MPDTEETNWRDEYKAIEQSFMVLKDQYSEVARALGFKGASFWGDPRESHEEIVATAENLRAGVLAQIQVMGQEYDNAGHERRLTMQEISFYISEKKNGNPIQVWEFHGGRFYHIRRDKERNVYEPIYRTIEDWRRYYPDMEIKS